MAVSELELMKVERLYRSSNVVIGHFDTSGSGTWSVAIRALAKNFPCDEWRPNTIYSVGHGNTPKEAIDSALRQDIWKVKAKKTE